jgi:hypothetical protein
MLHTLCGGGVEICLALYENDVGGRNVRGVGCSSNRNEAIATESDDLQTILLDIVDVFLPRIYQRNVKPAFREKAAEQASHCAGA